VADATAGAECSTQLLPLPPPRRPGAAWRRSKYCFAARRALATLPFVGDSSRSRHRARERRLGRAAWLAAALVGLVWGCGTAATGAGAPPPEERSEASASAPETAGASTSPAASVTAAPPTSATSAASASPRAAESVYVPLVPVVGFWSGLRSIDRSDLGLLLAGKAGPGSAAFDRIVIQAQDAAGLARAFGIRLAPSVRTASPQEVLAAVQAQPGTLGIVRAEQVTPAVRALAVSGFSLFGSGRMKDASLWPLSVRSTTPSTFDNTGFWTLTAGGDVNLDRSVYFSAVRRGEGPDYPWDGGTARIAGRTCCGFEGNQLLVARRTGNAGSVRRLLSASDIALVNLEGLAAEDYVYRQDGFTFSVDADLLAGLAGAGIDAVSLANNHTRDVGAEGIAYTCGKLDSLGIAHAGAGANVAAASAPAWLEAAGLRVAFLAFDAPQTGNWARATRPGAAPFVLGDVVAAIRAARATGADFVVVMPHWGTEYTLYVSRAQRRAAAAMVAAGADLVLGSHSHYVGGMQAFTRPDGAPALVVYSMGNLLFDFNYDERTQQGVLYELTFDGSHLVQVGINPTVMVGHDQVNLLSPAGDGATTIRQIQSASSGYVDW
jgi:poly-gamma-glutamate capsule biosynthesis protein CapA/YwtB (metallophosphatase superfamily)